MRLRCGEVGTRMDKMFSSRWLLGACLAHWAARAASSDKWELTMCLTCGRTQGEIDGA